jgi:type VI secretion system secreted protein VgrG
VEQAVIGQFAHSDFDYLKPTTPLTVQASGLGSMKGVYYEFPGNYNASAQGNTLANSRLLAAELPKSLMQGSSTVPFFSPGSSFTLSQHLRADANKPYVILDCHHVMDVSGRVPADEAVYKNRFRAFPKTVTFKPPRKTLRPRMPSVQTAIVTGKAGEEIWTDAYGRVKVHFHWDHAGKRDETSSCWVRVAQTWAGNGWGTQFIPRIGQEVVVTFVDGDPDRPLITGVVYNGAFAPPYPADQATKSTIKTSSTKGNKGFNELRFEDKAGSEEIYMHAQKDVTVDIVNNRTTLIEKGDESLTIKTGNRAEHINKNDQLLIDQGNKALKITQGNMTTTLSKGDQTTVLSQGNRTTKIKGNDSLTIQGNLTEEITGNYTLKIGQDFQMTVGGQLTIQVTGPINIKTNTAAIVNAAANLVLKSGGNVTMESAAAFLVKGGAIGTIQAGAPLMIKGAIVKIN